MQTRLQATRDANVQDTLPRGAVNAHNSLLEGAVNSQAMEEQRRSPRKH